MTLTIKVMMKMENKMKNKMQMMSKQEQEKMRMNPELISKQNMNTNTMTMKFLIKKIDQKHQKNRIIVFGIMYSGAKGGSILPVKQMTLKHGKQLALLTKLSFSENGQQVGPKNNYKRKDTKKSKMSGRIKYRGIE